MTAEPAQHQLAIPECRLDENAFGAQLRRYRELSRHVEQLERRTGEVIARFDAGVSAGLLEQTLSVERECCPFVVLEYDATRRQLTITVQNIAQDPRLDSLFHALTERDSRTRPTKREYPFIPDREIAT
jgi:hypothetical protein